MTIKKIQKILEKHGKWLRGEGGGERADFRCTDLSSVDLRGKNLSHANLRNANLRNAKLDSAYLDEVDLSEADLSNANLNDANLCLANLSRADLCNADLRNVNFDRANLSRADFRGADLRGANLDFSSFPLWCGGFKVICDKRIAAQLAYHFCRLICDDPDFVKTRNTIIDFANQFHRVEECGELKPMEVPK